MYDFAILAFAAIAAIASVLAVLPPLGFDIRIYGRQTVPLTPTESKRTRKAWLALALAVLSLGLSAGAFYYFFRPRIVQNTIEKNVERSVPIPCPEQKAPEATPIPGDKPIKKSGHIHANPVAVPKVRDSPRPPQTVVSAPGGIPIIGNQGIVSNPTVNNFGPPPLPTPTVSVCVSHPKATETAITLTTDVQITRPWFVFFFDAAVDQGSFSMERHTFGCNCPMRADKLPNPERSMGFRLASIDMGSNIWFSADGPIKATIESKAPVNLVNILSGGGDNLGVGFPEKIVYRCD